MINNSKHQIISSNIAPNPIEVKFWLDTNSKTLKTYKDGKWEAMTGGGSNSSSGSSSNILDVTAVTTGENGPDADGWYNIPNSEWEKAKNFKNSPCSHIMIKTSELATIFSIARASHNEVDGEWSIDLLANMSDGSQMVLAFNSTYPDKVKLIQ